SMLNLPVEDRFKLLIQILENSSIQRNRVDVLSDIECLTPVIDSFEEGLACAEVCQAILDVVRWLPYDSLLALEANI
ncbi:MAG: hypothetical protein AAF633_06020, partial [Chloroflexota bacterium]